METVQRSEIHDPKSYRRNQLKQHQLSPKQEATLQECRVFAQLIYDLPSEAITSYHICTAKFISTILMSQCEVVH
jgi:hypothetical protein